MTNTTPKLIFKYLLQNQPYVLLNQKTQTTKNLTLLIDQNSTLYLTTHFKLSQIFYKTQLVDMFAYETPNFTHILKTVKDVTPKNSTVLVYNFHNLINQTRYFLFTVSTYPAFSRTHAATTTSLDSITELFSTSWWLEREVAELHGLAFSGKKDTRNLMLQYGDTSAPFRKIAPSSGYREIFYDSVSDLIVYSRISFQG